jgi:hypothetical protein
LMGSMLPYIAYMDPMGIYIYSLHMLEQNHLEEFQLSW